MSTWIDLGGWTLLHFVWQGALVWGVAALALRAATTAQARYALACSALVMMLAAPVVTAFALSQGAAALQIIRRPVPESAIPGASAPIAAMTVASSPENASTSEGAAMGISDAGMRSIMPMVVAIWLAGVAVLLARLVGGCWRIRRLHAIALTEPVSRWQTASDVIARRLRLARPLFVVDSDRVDTPTVIGWLRPIVVLPIAAMANLTSSQVEAILAHELAHIRRHDFVVNMLQAVAETLLFYHPAIWWMSRRIRVERENCCDDVAVEVCGDPVTYATALTELAAWSVNRTPLVLAATSGSLITRVRRLLRVAPETMPRTPSRVLVLALALTLLVVVGTARVITVAQVPATVGTVDDGRLGPREINRLIGFNLFPGPQRWPTEDPYEGRAWGVTIRYANGEMPMKGFTARSLIRHAYDLPGIPIVGAPRWLDDESFDVTITSGLSVTAGVADPQGLNSLLRDMVERQLGLVVHREQRDFPVYALVKANADGRLGPNIAVSTSDCVGDSGRVFSRRFCGIDNDLSGISAEKVTLAQFVAEMQHTMPLAPDLPVVDRTGLTDKYDFRIRFGLLPIAAIASEHPAFGIVVAPFGVRSMFTALPEQLGLKLEKSTAPFEVLVIDHIQRP